MAYKEMYFVSDSYGNLTVHPEVLSITQNSNNTRIKLCGNFTDEALVWATIIQADGKTLPRRAVMLTTETIEIDSVSYRVYSYRLVQDDTKTCPSATGTWKISFSIEDNGEEVLTTNEYSLTIMRSNISAVTNTPADTIDAVATKVNQNTLNIAELESDMASIDLNFEKKVDKTTVENVVYATDRFGTPTEIEYDNSYTTDPYKGTIVRRTGIGGIFVPPESQVLLDSAASIRTVNAKVEENVTNKLGEPNGIATLDGGGKIPSGQLPSYVDDVIEVDSYSELPETGEGGKIYVTKDTNLTYRWGGSGYVEISKSLAIGETAQTAYRGDRGKELYDFVSPAFESGKNLQDKLDLKADKTELIKAWLTPTVTDNEFTVDCADNLNYVLDNAQDIEITITNAYNGYVGRIITNATLTLPANSSYDADFDYITVDDDFPLYEYQFDCIETGGIMYYKWSRKATQALGV